MAGEHVADVLSVGDRTLSDPAPRTKASEPEAVDAFLKRLKHPLIGLVKALRRTILAAAPDIGEEIKWNAPAFFFTGPMKPFDPREYKRHLVVLNFYRKDSIRLVFWHGDRAKDKSGFLTGEYPDGRRLATLASAKELTSRKKALVAALKAQLEHIHHA
jgi:hypothetical protein